jgi:hypothetical protein
MLHLTSIGFGISMISSVLYHQVEIHLIAFEKNSLLKSITGVRAIVLSECSFSGLPNGLLFLVR